MPFGPQKNIKTDYGAVGDGILVTATVSITSGLKALSCTTNQWSAGDVGKRIIIDGGGAGVAGTYDTKIDAFTDAQHITLHDAATSTLTNSVQTLGWGTDDSAAFTAFQTAAIAALPLGADLLIPAGVYMLSGATTNIQRWTRFLPLLRVTGSGNPTLIGSIILGGYSFQGVGAISARVGKVNAGDRHITLSSIADVSKVTLGNRITQSDGLVYTSGSTLLLTDQDMQGFGFPSNPWDWEFVTLTNVDAATGVISVSAPIKNTYLTTYPHYVDGSSFQLDEGGPATVYVLDATFDANNEYIGLRFWLPGAAINGSCRTIKFTSCTWLSQFGPNPSVADTWTADGCDMSACGVETDKIINNFTLQNSTTVHSITFQSGSIENFTCSNSTIQNFCQGTARTNTINNSAFGSLNLGASAYGRTDSVAASNSTFTSITPAGANYQDITNLGFTLSNGVLKWDKSNGPVRIAVPGTFIVFAGPQECETGFATTSLTDDGVSTLVGTTLSGSSFPPVPRQGGTRLDMAAHPAPSITFTSCSGCADALDLSNAGAQGKPVYSYTKRSYTGNTLVSPPSARSWGNLVSVTVNVSQPFTGAGALSLNLFGQFQTAALDPNDAQTAWLPSVNLKVAGVRTITPTTVTGAQAGDVLTAPGKVWFAGPQTPFASADVSGQASNLWPIVSIEVQTNQGLPSPPSPPSPAIVGIGNSTLQRAALAITGVGKSGISALH